MNYQEGLQFIHSFKANGRRPDLKRMVWLLNRLGNPQQHFPAIHVVGTNGKGSTSCFLQHIFSKAGYKTGTFTSPYIKRFNERIAIDGREITDQELLKLLAQIQPSLRALERDSGLGRPTEFEIVTLLMFLYFAQNQVDIAIIEAGIGGLHDSTNVFHPKAVVCTSIGLDHTETLGNSFDQIAQQKIGVLKRGTPLIFSHVPDQARQIFLDKAAQCQSPTFELGKDFSFLDKGQTFDFTYHDTLIPAIPLKMLGNHQKANASLAVMTSLVLTADFPAISKTAIREGLAESSWPGRGELFENKILLDGAHNEQGMAALLELLQSDFSDRKIHVLFAGLRRKPLENMLKQLEAIAFDLAVTDFDFADALPLNDYSRDYRRVYDWKNWLAQVRQMAQPDDLYLMTGSLYFIADVRNYVMKNKKI